MKNLFALVLIAALFLGGCSKKIAVDDQAMTQETAPVTAPASTPEVEVAAPAEPELKVEIAIDKIFFDFDSYALTAAHKSALKDNALWMKAHPDLRIIIEGYTDERGSSSYNLALGEKRAKAVRAHLLNLGVASERVSVVSYGKEQAAKGAGSEAVWALDRRAEFVLAN